MFTAAHAQVDKQEPQSARQQLHRLHLVHAGNRMGHAAAQAEWWAAFGVQVLAAAQLMILSAAEHSCCILCMLLVARKMHPTCAVAQSKYIAELLVL